MTKKLLHEAIVERPLLGDGANVIQVGDAGGAKSLLPAQRNLNGNGADRGCDLRDDQFVQVFVGVVPAQ